MKLIDILRQEDPVEPETLYQLGFAKDSFDVVRILAMRTCLHSRAPYIDFHVFENVCLALNDIEPNTEQVEGCQPHWIWKALQIMEKIGARLDFEDEVKSYIKFIHEDAGLQFYPPQSGIANPLLEQIKLVAQEGPFPLGEEPLEIQATYYLKIEEYLGSN